jgi:site-specific recombinase XerD
MTQLAEIIQYNPIDLAVESWIAKSRARSGSIRTPATYRETLLRFRRTLQQFSTDLDGDTRAIALIAQQWASAGGVRPSTHNQRLAVVSSFYTHAAFR